MSTWPLLRLSILLASLLTLECCAGGVEQRVEEPFDPEIANAAAAAQTAFARGECNVAATYYGRALKRARAADNALAIGNYAYNMAICLIATAQLEPARRLLEEAEMELNRAGVALADVFLVQAYLAYHLAHAGQATALAAVEVAARRVLDDPDSRPNDVQRAQATLLLAEVICQRGDPVAADAHLAAAQRLAGTSAPLGLQAGLARAAACISLLRHHPAEAGQHFDEEAKLMQTSRRYADMAKALQRAGEAYRKAALNRIAVERYYRAARSWLGQSNPVQAEKALQAADAAAVPGQAEPLKPLLNGLRAEIRRYRAAN